MTEFAITVARDWRKSFKLTLIHWAATLEDPFGTNVVMDDTVTEVWKAVFPSIANEVDSGSRDAIIHVVSYIQLYFLLSHWYWEYRPPTPLLTGGAPWVKRDFVSSSMRSMKKGWIKKMHHMPQSTTSKTTASFTDDDKVCFSWSSFVRFCPTVYI